MGGGSSKSSSKRTPSNVSTSSRLSSRSTPQHANVVKLDGQSLFQLVCDEKEFKPLCKALYQKYDKDSNGTLSKREIKGAILGMRKDLALPPPTSRDEEHAAIETSFAKIDADGDGVVNAQEFESFLKETLLEIARCLQEHPITVALLDGSVLREIVKDKDEFDRVWRELFTLADTNGDGKLTKKEVKPTVIGLAEMLGIPSPTTSIEAEEMVNAAFAEIDRDGDRYIQRDEFEDLIRGALLTVADRLHKHPVTVVVQE